MFLDTLVIHFSDLIMNISWHFEVRSLFLGYSNYQKRYWCLDLSTIRVYISQHVIFNEHSFPTKALLDHTTSRSTTPATGKPLIIPSSIISSTLLSNVFAVVAP
jgi:hypothetical protein